VSASCGGFFDLPKPAKDLAALEARMSAADFWSNRNAPRPMSRRCPLRSLITPFHELEREVEDFGALQQLAAEEADATARTRAEHKSRPSTTAPPQVGGV